LYGRIASDNLLSAVSYNESTFRLVLRCVRFWALRRGVYSVNCGYFSGITLSVLVARVCQDYPDLHASCIIYKFFEKYSNSDWREPVQLNSKGRKGNCKNLNSSHLNALNQISNDVMVVLVPID
jgi:poly(A) polymerase Pap1